ncbi:MAG: glyoxylate/hydroxypyruvate reductase A [Rhodothermales bacterium]
MPLVFVCPNRAMTAWVDALHAVAPEIDLRIWPDDGPPEDVAMAVTWKHPAGVLRRYPNLKAVLSLGAGIDHFLTDDALPAGPAYGRIVDPQLVAGMSQYVAAAVLDAHRGFAGYRQHQAERRWQPEAYAPAGEWPVGLLGLGAMGMDAARVLRALGYPVLGWSTSPKPDAPFETFTGEAGLDRMLPRCRALVCLLPLTGRTRGILDRSLFDRLPRGAYLINAARGGHLVEADLTAALEAGRLAGAWLDVFNEEPLPAAHPFWTHPAITVTPHIASITNPVSAAPQVVADYRSALAGRALTFPVDLERAY